jgi:CheY-like chemotaxis protein
MTTPPAAGEGLRRLHSEFAMNVPMYAVELPLAVQDADWAQVEEIARSIRTVSSRLGYSGLAKASEAILQRDEPDPDAYESLIELLHTFGRPYGAGSMLAPLVGVRVLLIQRNDDVAAAGYQELQEVAGARFAHVSDIEDGLVQCQISEVDVVVLDLKPDRAGWIKAVARMRQNNPLIGIVARVVTVDARLLQAARAAGADVAIPMGPEPGALTAAVCEVLAHFAPRSTDGPARP